MLLEILKAIEKEGCIDFHELSRLLNMEKATVEMALRQLAQSGYLSTVRNQPMKKYPVCFTCAFRSRCTSNDKSLAYILNKKGKALISRKNPQRRNGL